ncbi:MAG: type VI secretion system domain-containing protein, partial [Deltaproteobacteria bacterium]|nr:type VI secretion system domain-containing protein [Deltaproteobacteria bacterium]
WRRIASWAMIDAVPAATDGQTIVPPPDISDRNILEELKEKRNWEALAESAEQRVTEFIFWLDLNRFVAEALIGLGDSYQDAYDTVCLETAIFVHRLAGVESLCFSDGTPFADEDTKQWLGGISLGGGAEMAQPVAVNGPEGRGDMADTIEKAQKLAKKKKLGEAVSLFQEGLRDSFSKKQQLMWRLALSQLLVSVKKPQLALPHLESILEDIDRHGLEEWDPELALKGLKIAWTGLNVRGDETGKEQATVILKRIAKLSPAEALRLAK